MRKLSIVLLGLAVLAVSMLGTACKPRNAKALAMAQAPRVNPCGVSSFVGSITPTGSCGPIFGSTVGYPTQFNVCSVAPVRVHAAGAPVGYYENVFSVTITEPGDYAFLTGLASSSYICSEVRTNCNPGDDSAIIGYDSNSSGTEIDLTLGPGTYYFVIDTQGEAEYAYNVCYGFAP